MEPIHFKREELEPFRSKLFLLSSDNGWFEQGIGFGVVEEEVFIIHSFVLKDIFNE